MRETHTKETTTLTVTHEREEEREGPRKLPSSYQRMPRGRDQIITHTKISFKLSIFIIV